MVNGGIHKYLVNIYNWLMVLTISKNMTVNGKDDIPYIVENDDHDWLVIEPTPLKNMSSSVGMMTFPIYGKITSVPNHQPDFYDIVMIYDREHEMG